MSIMNYWFWFWRWRSFQVCWTPIQTVLLYKSVTSNLEDWDTNYNMIVLQVKCQILLFLNTLIFILQICSHVLAYTNSCLNPILYAKMSRNFRCGFSQVRSKINIKYTKSVCVLWRTEGFSMTLFAWSIIEEYETERADDLDGMYKE